MDKEKLIELGFSQKEAHVYLSLLESGSSTVRDIAKRTRLNRSTCYVVLNTLSQKGLVSTTDEQKIRLYTCAPPDRLIQLLEEQIKLTQKRVVKAQHLLPELKSYYSGTTTKPTVQYYDGAEGLVSVYEDTLTATERIDCFASIEDVHAALPDYFPEYYERRMSRGIHMNAIFPDTGAACERASRDKEEYRTTRLIPKEEYGFNSEINVYDNKIVFMSLREKFGLIVESKELSDTLKKIFKLAWKAAGTINSKTK